MVFTADYLESQSTSSGGAPAVAATATSSSSGSSGRTLVKTYCVACHSKAGKVAGLDLESLDPAQPAAAAETWEKVIRKLRGGAMPPPGMRRPPEAEVNALVSSLETELDRAAAANPNPGRTEVFHRLNRAEYQNAIRDLLGLEIDSTAWLPADDASNGFDNQAGVLKISQSLMERYLNAARNISRMAVGLAPPSVTQETYRVPNLQAQYSHVEGLPFGTRGGTVVRHNFPQTAEYEFVVQLYDEFTYNEPHEILLLVDGEVVKSFMMDPPRAGGGRGGGAAAAAPPQVPATTPPAAGAAAPAAPVRAQRSSGSSSGAGGGRGVALDYPVRLKITGGPHEVGATFAARPLLAQPDTTRKFFTKPQTFQNHGDMPRSQPFIEAVVIEGPYNAEGPGDTPSRRKILVCKPGGAVTEAACSRQILSRLARTAFRRAVTPADLKTLTAFYEEGRKEGTFDQGIERAVRFILVSPDFLFRTEPDPVRLASSQGSNYRLSDVELASRLSFFLWSSIPDDELLDAAIKGTLSNSAVYERQVRRMLADPKADALVRNFTGQWLQLRNLAAAEPDPPTFPDFDEDLRQGFRRETEMFFASILRNDRPVTELLSADYTFLDERLARHYGIPNVSGDRFRRVQIEDPQRRGLLAQGSILTVRSRPNRTSPVLRGVWVMENLLGTPPPPPPPVVPPLQESKEKKVLSMRERMAEHRANPACASCHSVIDPIGFAFEHFDAVGKWRDVDDAFQPIDTAGTLPNGVKFDGVPGLRDALLKSPQPFITTVTERLLTYALGRGLEYYDAPVVRSIIRGAGPDPKLSSLVLGITKSSPFQMRRTAPSQVASAKQQVAPGRQVK